MASRCAKFARTHNFYRALYTNLQELKTSYFSPSKSCGNTQNQTIMPVVPKVIFLYDNDAVEVRYSDESRLELSPCGAAMVFHPPSRPGENPRHRLSQQIHKRTQFVTSDHKQKVLQALDFRNRFAKRPYLCEELLNSFDIVPLYASVHQVKWPKSHSVTNVDVLPDGSRKITSLDEYASLIVSPHGQDFSVCYLSRISSDVTNTHNLPRPLSPPHLPHHAKKFQANRPVGKGEKKASEAVIYPYRHVQMDSPTDPNNVKHLDDVHYKIGNSCNSNSLEYIKDQGCNEDKRNYSIQQQGKISRESIQNEGIPNPQQHHSVEMDNNLQKFVTDAEFHSDQLYNQIPSNTQSSVQVLPNLQSPVSSSLPQFSEIQSNSLPSHYSNIKFSNDAEADEQQDVAADISSSPLPHEISSISRSSTPDGLRTTIDSEATLIHDTTENEAMRYRHRHSSPTHFTSNPDDLQLPFAKLVDIKSSSLQVSFHDSPSDHQKKLSVGLRCDNDLVRVWDKHEFSGHKKVPDSQTNSSQACDVSTLSQSSTLCQSEALDLTPTNQDVNNKYQKCPVSQNFIPSHGIIEPCQKIIPDNEMKERIDFNQDSPIIAPISQINVYDIPASLSRTNDVPDSQPIRSHSKASCVPGENSSEILSHFSTIQEGIVHGSSSLSSSSHLNSASGDLDLKLESKSASKLKYIWTTSHGSRSNCPKEWMHPLMLALQGNVTANKGEASSNSTTLKDRDLHRTSLPQPLPVKCPFQHTHKSTQSQHLDEQDEHNQAEAGTNIGVFQRGRLKVVLSEGIIYRLIPASGMTVVEIYPGDGSVLISQGAKAFFFTHFIPGQDQLEERMYSLKSLPPSCAKKFRPIEKMMKTANRFLHICLSWDKRVGKINPPCWQKEMVAVVEPLSSSILEECVVDGLGKFTAYSNGRVRIVFDDRTALDMMSDFSPRLGTMAKVPSVDAEDGTVRFLLPSGNYMLVEKKSSGPYSQYLKTANEWIAWVNTSPSERHRFYMQDTEPALLDKAARLELKKITCFNYILDNTFSSLQHQDQCQGRESCFGTSAEASTVRSIHHKTDTNLSTPLLSNNQHTNYSSSQHTDYTSNQLTNHTSNQHTNYASSQHTNYTPSSLGRCMSRLPPDIASMETTVGFQSVRQALAHTSSLIHDIEHFLEENK